jgi:hypothetical protein
MSHEVLLRTQQQRIDNYDFKEYEMPVSQMSGPHVALADLPLAGAQTSSALLGAARMPPAAVRARAMAPGRSLPLRSTQK